MAKRFNIKYWLTDDGLERVRLYSNDGLTQKEIAKMMGCSLTTLKKYAAENIELIKAINCGRDGLLTEIEISAYKQAKGYYKTIIEYEKVETEVKGETSTIIKRTEREVYNPPDWRATSFIMRNLKPEVWDKLKQESVKAQQSLADSAFNMLTVRMEGIEDDDLGG